MGGFGGFSFGAAGFGLGPFGGGGFGEQFPVRVAEIWATGSLLSNFSMWRINETSGAPGTIPGAPPTTEGPLYPLNWVRSKGAQQTMITAPTVGSDILNVPQSTINDLVSVPSLPSTTNYYFDAVIRILHKQDLAVTRHPVQTGAAISDHAYLQPSQVELEIKMSDTLRSYQNGQYTGPDASRSVSAYQTFLILQALRVPLVLTTRLDTYQNMLITSIEAPDDVKTQYGLRCFIRMQQIIPAQLTTATFNTNRQHDTESSNFGTKIGDDVTGPILQSHNVGFEPVIPPGQIQSVGFAEEPAVPGHGISGATAWSSNVIAPPEVGKP